MRLVASALAFLLTSCWPYAYYETDRIGTEVVPGIRNPVNSDKYRIESETPCFAFATTFLPPKPYWGDWWEANPIEESDRWCITHQFGTYHVLQSEAFNKRRCKFLKETNIFGMCTRPTQYGLWYDPSTNAVDGWAVLPGRNAILSERIRNLFGPKKGAEAWPTISEL